MRSTSFLVGLFFVAASATAATVSVSGFKGTVYSPGEASLVRTLHAEFEGNDLNREKMLILYFHQLLLLLIRQSERKYRRHPDWTANYVQEYIQKNYTADISPGQIAEELHLTPERLCRLYKAHFGITLKKRINQLRVDHACALLKNSGLEIREIRTRSGFHDLSNFYRIFQSEKKMTPQQYRKV